MTGTPVPLLEKSMVLGGGAANFIFSDEGTLAYISSATPGNRQLAWVDREGNASPSLPIPQRGLKNPRLSPGGSRAAFTITNDALEDIWVYEPERDILTPFTQGGGNSLPAWSPDEHWIVFASTRSGDSDIYRRPADFSGEVEPLLVTEHAQHPLSFSADGKTLLYVESHPANGSDIWALPFDGEGSPRALLQTSSSETAATLSPDGRWMAYVTDESGRDEVYVQPYPGPGRRWQISNAGGGGPIPSGRGTEESYSTRQG